MLEYNIDVKWWLNQEKLKDKYNLKYLNDFCFFADFIKVFGFLILTNWTSLFWIDFWFFQKIIVSGWVNFLDLNWIDPEHEHPW